jgi:diguanylate cyclase (GGDEF)-like protein
LLNITDKLSGAKFDDVDLSLLEIVGPQIAVALERSEWQERASQFQLMSITDPLTGLLNRRYLEERLTEELNRSKRYNYAMSCLMIDIDDFKKYNDRNGHQAGDVALKITAHSLKAVLRSADIACRYGGEEFCILLPQTTVSEAGVIAERMRQKVAETEYPHGKTQPMGRVSISIGISTFAKHIDTAESVIAAADRALYNAKSHGKNRIEFYVDNLTGPSVAK